MRTADQIHETIAVESFRVVDPLAQCDWCGYPLEKGDPAWFAENDHADAVGCSKACARSSVFGRTPRHDHQED